MDTGNSVCPNFNDCPKILKSPNWWELMPHLSVIIGSSTDSYSWSAWSLILISSTTRKFLTQYTDIIIVFKSKTSLLLAFPTNSTFELEL